MSDDDEGPLVQLDAAGRLRGFQAPLAGAGSARPAPSWEALFRLADIDYQRAQPGAATGRPASGLEQWRSWRLEQGSSRPPLFVHAALVQGRLVRFVVQSTSGVPAKEIAAEGLAPWGFVLRVTLQIGLLAISLVLAARNVRSGAADLRGAAALAALVAGLCALEWVFYVRHSPELIEEVAAAYWWLAHSCLLVVFAASGYLGLEPLARAHWPQALVGLERLRRGNWRDGVVARELLLGLVFGVAMQLALQAFCLLPAGGSASSDLTPMIGAAGDLRNWLGLWPAVGTIVHLSIDALWVGIAALLLLCVLRGFARRDWLAAVLFCLLVAWLKAPHLHFAGDRGWWFGLLQGAALWLVLARGGLVAAIVGAAVFGILTAAPLTTHPSAWYAGAAMLSLALVLGLVGLAVWLRGGRGGRAAVA
jgi:serine/threonine-protein kinase